MATVLATTGQITVPAGNFGPFAGTLPGNSAGVELRFTRVSWPSGVVGEILVEASYDAGNTWLQLGSTQFTEVFGGTSTGWFRCYWPERDGVPQVPDRVRGSGNLNQSITTTLTLSAL